MMNPPEESAERGRRNVNGAKRTNASVCIGIGVMFAAIGFVALGFSALQGCSSSGGIASNNGSDASDTSDTSPSDDAGSPSTSGQGSGNDKPFVACGLQAEQLDDTRTCAVGHPMVEALCERSPGPQALSDIAVCAVDPKGTMYRFFIASNWTVVEAPGWSYAQRSAYTPTTNNSPTAPLSSSDLTACTKLQNGAVEDCKGSDAGTD